MNPSENKPPWSVFDGVNTISLAPEALMIEINSAITALEYARAASFLESPFSHTSKTRSTSEKSINSQYDASVADEAYKAGSAAMAAGKMDKAVVSFNTALTGCPLEQTCAVAKIQSLISLTCQQVEKS